MTLTEAKNKIVAEGFDVSAGSFEDDCIVYACSIQSVCGCMGHPEAEVTYNKQTGRTWTGGIE